MIPWRSTQEDWSDETGRRIVLAQGPANRSRSAYMSAFDEAYERRRPALERAVRQLKLLLRDVVGRIEDRRLVRAEFDDVRPKGLSSLKRKARRAGWSPDDALSQCPDLVAGRVVCTNVEDVYRFEALLRECLPIESGSPERQDYIDHPKQGYRALHLNFRLNAGQGFEHVMIPCEVQIRSRFQDAWAKIVHADIYKQDNLPPDLRDRAEDLSRLLAVAEEIAGDIRARARQLTEPPEEQPRFDRVSPEGLAYIFKDVFGRAPPDYAVTMCLNMCDDLGIGVLEGLPEILKRQDFRDRLGEAYNGLLPVPIDSETIMLAALHALAGDDRAAVRYARAQAQRQFDEIDNFARREMLSAFPATVGELIAELDDPQGETDVVFLAEALGATNDCPYCGATVVDAYGFVEDAMHHYELSGDEADQAYERIEQAIYSSGVDTGGLGDSAACSHCAAQLSKDD